MSVDSSRSFSRNNSLQRWFHGFFPTLPFLFWLKPWGRGCYVRIYSGSIFSASWSWILESQLSVVWFFCCCFFWMLGITMLRVTSENFKIWFRGDDVSVDVLMKIQLEESMWEIRINKGAYLRWNLKSVGNYCLVQVSISWFQVSHWCDVRATCIERSLHLIFSSYTFIGNGLFHMDKINQEVSVH